MKRREAALQVVVAIGGIGGGPLVRRGEGGEFPGQLQKVYEWFRDYKIPDGKPPNAFGYDAKCMDAAFAAKVVEETHGFYNALKSGRRANDGELSLI